MERLLRRLEQIFMAMAVICMVMVMLIVAYDAIARYAFNSPLPWAFEILTNFILIALTYFAISSTFQHGDHIGVDLFYNLMGKRARAWCDLTSAVLALALFAMVVYGTWGTTLKFADRGAVDLGYLSLPAWLSYLPVPLGAGLLVLRLLSHITALIRNGEDPNVVIHGDAR